MDLQKMSEAELLELQSALAKEWERRATQPLVDKAQAEVVTDLQERGKLPKPPTSTVDTTGKATKRVAWVDPGTIHEKMYRQGDIVEHNGKLWKSMHPFLNSWEPGGVGIDSRIWAEYVEPEEPKPPVTETPAPSTPTAPTVPEFKQPTGAHDAYAQGAKVTFQGAVYESLIPNNAYSPTAYPQGWKKL